ncbi:dephospho-CoA kinase [Nitrosovibrio tenuis]|uniref:Dephospho-CoA kinase n=1 Tax=Nitrosovibrio tenuis TaxID=1233 RepID=A0A1H7QDJ4_9PROT|nr:dephospho-CoA kinase [Nitrosovibrio tenuis]
MIIGLTGGIGSGKTAAATFFAALGADVIDTDVIAHELTRPHGAAISAVRQAFGERYITEDSALNRKEMRKLIFSDDDSRRKLEAILHPLIRTEVARRAALFCGPYGLIVVPLLLETCGYREMIHRVLVVDCCEYDQIARTVGRTGMDEQTVRAIMATQLSRAERLQQADDVISNDSDISHLKQQVEALHSKYLALRDRG